ncbi:hypothetical protein Pan44_47740 [Caulifigura coniformis]|uniref:Uncharacterized protein n=1 Tax=Caulifigura coniformis TaxID=2527983 RepID=A0A517SKR5_9PLAN|nr:hypothetical protein [Caulifigura coniformis]QDT56717.1 hypothetical protein Pan44_47740 [Caulifigura coniformis]
MSPKHAQPVGKSTIYLQATIGGKLTTFGLNLDPDDPPEEAIGVLFTKLLGEVFEQDGIDIAIATACGHRMETRPSVAELGAA